MEDDRLGADSTEREIARQRGLERRVPPQDCAFEIELHPARLQLLDRDEVVES